MDREAGKMGGLEVGMLGSWEVGKVKAEKGIGLRVQGVRLKGEKIATDTDREAGKMWEGEMVKARELKAQR